MADDTTEFRNITYRLLPQKKSNWRWLDCTLKAQRQLYNAALEERIDCYREIGMQVRDDEAGAAEFTHIASDRFSEEGVTAPAIESSDSRAARNLYCQRQAPRRWPSYEWPAPKTWWLGPLPLRQASFLPPLPAPAKPASGPGWTFRRADPEPEHPPGLRTCSASTVRLAR